jgi:hypothetical protein
MKMNIGRNATIALYLLTIRPAVCGSSYKPGEAQDVEHDDAVGGWNILNDPFLDGGLLDGLSLEWEYYMLHDKDGRFTGSIGYVLADPRRKLNGLMPTGASAAVAGKFPDGTPTADFLHFPLSQSVYPDSQRLLFGSDGSDRFLSIEPGVDGQGNYMHLQGRSAVYEWDVVVRQDWSNRDLMTDQDAFAPVSSDDVGLLPGETWTVNMVWPRTRVLGRIDNLQNGESTPIDGHGYRENSYGRYAFVADGWDFAVISDESSSVQWAWQSYHRSNDMDYLDVTFIEDGELEAAQFRARDSELSWHHPSWKFDKNSNQCTPTSTVVKAENDDYKVSTDIDIGDNQVPMLSDLTIMTKAYVINAHLSQISGIIRNKHTGNSISFRGQAGGEFATWRSPFYCKSAWWCKLWGRQFRR